MRRRHSEIVHTTEIERILSIATIGRMASIGADGCPYVTPVNFVYHNGNVYFHGAPTGEKLVNIARDPRVCFEVDIPLSYLDSSFEPERRGCKVHQFYHCVIIRGEARVVPDGPVKTAALNALVSKHEPGRELEPVTDDVPAYRACAVVEIRPRSISAKSDLAQDKPPEARLARARYLEARGLPLDLDTVKAMGFEPGALAAPPGQTQDAARDA
jgi:nitroimidazol reductase NimA-like FMN-containing flavoprotein (pyridoxamine 5'-phosphate oxidase superfamily)